jgi:hypothetical protein
MDEALTRVQAYARADFEYYVGKVLYMHHVLFRDTASGDYHEFSGSYLVRVIATEDIEISERIHGSCLEPTWQVTVLPGSHNGVPLGYDPEAWIDGLSYHIPTAKVIHTLDLVEDLGYAANDVTIGLLTGKED